MGTNEQGAVEKSHTWWIAAGIGVAVAASATAVALGARARTAPSATSVRTDDLTARIVKLNGTPDLRSAVDYLRPAATGANDADVAVLFGYWAARHLWWSDVDVNRDETTFKLYRKDPAVAFGKRLCVTAYVLSIEALPVSAGSKQFSGRFVDAAAFHARDTSAPPYQFIAVRSTSDIVDGSEARFCGVATGLFSFTSTSGKREGLQLVGMFDVPENRKH